MIDFCVIGGGVAGLSAGAHLSDLGNVLVLEREEATAYHASGRSAAMFEETYGAPSVRALTIASRAFYMDPVHDLLSPRGLMMVGNAETAEAFAQDAVSMGLEPLTFEEAQARVPILDPQKVDRAAYHANAWDIDTDKLIQMFTKVIRDHGGAVATGSEVTAISRTAQGWDITATETIKARVLVNAAGPWADEIAAMAGLPAIGLQPYRRSMARIPAPGGMDVRDWPMLFGPGETWYAKPDAGALIVSPAEEDASQPCDAWADDIVLAEGLDRYAQNVTEPVTRLLSSWAGLRTFAPDRTLVLGRAPQDDAFIWCAGQGGYGFQTAPAAGQLIADIVGERTPQLDPETIAALSPARFAA